MSIFMGVLKNRYGVFVARRKVPDALQVAVALETATGKPKVSWLQRSLGTKDAREAAIRGKPVLMEFDRILARAEAATSPKPFQGELSDSLIERIAGYHYASLLAEDEDHRIEGLYNDPEASPPSDTPGLSDATMQRLTKGIAKEIGDAEGALARANTAFLEGTINDLLDLFRINLDRSSAAYRKLSIAVLKQQVRALKALSNRHKGEVVDTPKLDLPVHEYASGTGETLTVALHGWIKSRDPSSNTQREFKHAIDRFIELHGDMAVASITRKHVLRFREALQDIPKRRAGSLIGLALPQLVEWAKEHPSAARLSPTTVNKLLGGVQAVAVWARDNGLVPDDVPWADPFSNMRLGTSEPERAPWEIPELITLFASPVFTEGERPKAAGGEAAFWLPLLGLFSGARLSELASLRVSEIMQDAATGIWAINIKEDEANNKRLKTTSSRRIVPVHPELIRLGFIGYVQGIHKRAAESAPIFPLLKKGKNGSEATGWSKWFGRYIRRLGIADTSHVFHSFRHSFKDALRAGGVGEDINDALTGHAGGGGVGRTYGAKEMLRRFGLPRLAEAVGKAAYPGLDLTRLSSH